MDPDQTARMRRLDWIQAGRKRTMLVLLCRGSYSIKLLVQIKLKIYPTCQNSLTIPIFKILEREMTGKIYNLQNEFYICKYPCKLMKPLVLVEHIINPTC
jgi:hypothetical protein